MLYLQITRHSIESCPMNNEKVKKATLNCMAKMEQINKKYGIKVVGMWSSPPEHMEWSVYDAPSMEALIKVSMEPEVMSYLKYNITEIHPVMTVEESVKLMK
jgi:muconolactone delta-isomerase